MASLVLTGDTSGQVTIAAPAVAGTNTITLAAQTGTLNVAGPAFSAYATANQSFANNTGVKVQFNAEEFDTANCFDSTTNYRFTPTVAGYYQVTTSISFSTNGTGTRYARLYKNGSLYKELQIAVASGAGYTNVAGSCLVYLNGSTDYVEIYAYQNSGSTLTTSGTQTELWFNGCLLRGA